MPSNMIDCASQYASASPESTPTVQALMRNLILKSPVSWDVKGADEQPHGAACAHDCLPVMHTWNEGGSLKVTDENSPGRAGR